jgi:dihydroorotase
MADAPRRLYVRGGTVVQGADLVRADVAIADGVVVEVGPDLAVARGATVLDAGGCYVAPGLVDLHAHLRQPGREEAETVETAARAGALGGYTALVAMPNTTPPIDSAAVAREVLELGRSACAEIAVAGCITLGRQGAELAPMGELAALGIQLFTDDGDGVQDGALMRRALDYARGLGVTLAQHCEDASLSAGGAMHDGAWSSRLGIPGIPAAAEEAMVARDIALVRLTRARLHFLHLSSAGSVALVRHAKAEGLPVTAEAAPHHFTLTDAALESYDPVFKVNPPLRSAVDVAAVREGLRDGTIDAIATDHAPHPPETKQRPIIEAPPGMLGLQTALALAFDAFVTGASDPGSLDVASVFGLFTTAPARIAGLGPGASRPGGHSAHGGPVAPGAAANLCVFDPSCPWLVRPEHLASRSANTPYAGRTLGGTVRHTVLRGEPVVVDAVAQR